MPAFRSGKPSFRVINNGSQALAAGPNKLTFDTLTFEEPAGWDGVDDYIVDRPGLYIAHVAVLRNTTATSSPLTTRLRINGASVAISQEVPTANVVPGRVSWLGHLEAGDEISANVTGHATAASSLVAGTAIMYAARIGPKRWT